MSVLSVFHASRQILRPEPYGFQQLLSGCRASIPGPKPRMTGFQPTFSRLSKTPLRQAIVRNEGNRKQPLPWLTGATVAGLGLGLASLNRSPVYCDTPPGSPNPSKGSVQPKWSDENLPPPPASSVSLYELGFGTVAGICAGVFVKKGAKMAAWFLGGIFVFLQYLNSASFVRVDWKRISSKFEDLFYSRDAAGLRKPPTVGSLWKSLVDFLTADFQPRASFIAGFALGLRIS